MRRKESRHYKMYKAKKIWMTAGLTTFAVAMGGTAFNVSAHADTVNNDSNTSSATTSNAKDSSATSSVATTQAIYTNATQSSDVTSTHSSSVISTQSSDTTLVQSSSVISTQSSDATLVQSSSVISTQSSDATSVQSSSVISTQSSDATSVQSSSVTSTQSSDATSVQSSSVISTQSSDATSVQSSSVISTQSSDAATTTLAINSVSSLSDASLINANNLASSTATTAGISLRDATSSAVSGITNLNGSTLSSDDVIASGAGILSAGINSNTTINNQPLGIHTKDGRYVQQPGASDAVPVYASDYGFDSAHLANSYTIYTGSNDRGNFIGSATSQLLVDVNGNAMMSGGTYNTDTATSIANNSSSASADLSNVKTLQFNNVKFVNSGSNSTSSELFSNLISTLAPNVRTVDFSNTSGWDAYTSFARGLEGLQQSVVSINFGNDMDTSNVTDMSDFISDSPFLTNLVAGSKFNTSKVTNFDGFINGIPYLGNIDFSSANFNLSSWQNTNQQAIFSEVGFGSTVKLGNNVGTLPSDITNMFKNSHIANLDLGTDFDVSKVTKATNAFAMGENLNFATGISTPILQTITVSGNSLKLTNSNVNTFKDSSLPILYHNSLGSPNDVTGSNAVFVNNGVYSTQHISTYNPYYDAITSAQNTIANSSAATQSAVSANSLGYVNVSQSANQAGNIFSQANSVVSSLNASYNLSDKSAVISQATSYANSIGSVVTSLNNVKNSLSQYLSSNTELSAANSQSAIISSLASVAMSYAVDGQNQSQLEASYVSALSSLNDNDEINSYKSNMNVASIAASTAFSNADINYFAVQSIATLFDSQASYINNSVTPAFTSGSASATSLFNTLNLNALLSQAAVATSSQAQANSQTASSNAASSQAASIAAELAKQSSAYAASIAALKSQQSAAIAAHDSSAASSAQSALTGQANLNDAIVNSLKNLQSNTASQVTSAISLASSNAGIASQNASALSSAQTSANSVTNDLASVNAQKNSLTSAYNSAVSSANSLSVATSSAYASEIASFSVAISSMLVAQSQAASSATSVQNSQATQNASLSAVNASLIAAQNSAKSSYANVQASYASASANAQSNYSSAMSSLQSVSNTKLSSATSLATSLSAAQSSAIQNHDSATASAYQSQMNSFVSATSSANTNALNSQSISLANSYAQQSQSVTPSSVAPISSSSSNTSSSSSSNNTVSTNEGYAKIDKAITVQYANGNLKLSPSQKPVFDVLRHTIESNGQHVYYVKYRGRIGKVVSKTSLFKPAYYKTLNFDKAANANGEAYVKVLHNIYEHRKDKFSAVGLKTYRVGSRIKVVGISNNKGVTRFQLANGHVITANKYYVSLIK